MANRKNQVEQKNKRGENLRENVKVSKRKTTLGKECLIKMNCRALWPHMLRILHKAWRAKTTHTSYIEWCSDVHRHSVCGTVSTCVYLPLFLVLDLSVYKSICRSICLSKYLPIGLPIYASTCECTHISHHITYIQHIDGEVHGMPCLELLIGLRSFFPSHVGTVRRFNVATAFARALVPWDLRSHCIRSYEVANSPPF